MRRASRCESLLSWQGNRMNGQSWPHLPACAAPTGLRDLFWSAFPALKRWANEHCAYGAGRSEPLESMNFLHAIALRPHARVNCNLNQNSSLSQGECQV
jgi:hypothetical protein